MLHLFLWIFYDGLTRKLNAKKNNVVVRPCSAYNMKANVVDAEFSPLPFRSACVLATGRSSWGKTPLHFAAQTGHDSVVEQLLEAKAAVDVKENDNGRFLRRGFGGEPFEAWDRGEDVNEMLICWWFRFLVFFF